MFDKEVNVITEKQAIQLGKNIATAINNELHSYYMAENGATKATMIASIREHLDFDSFNMLAKILNKD